MKRAVIRFDERDECFDTRGVLDSSLTRGEKDALLTFASALDKEEKFAFLGTAKQFDCLFQTLMICLITGLMLLLITVNWINVDKRNHSSPSGTESGLNPGPSYQDASYQKAYIKESFVPGSSHQVASIKGPSPQGTSPQNPSGQGLSLLGSSLQSSSNQGSSVQVKSIPSNASPSARDKSLDPEDYSNLFRSPAASQPPSRILSSYPSKPFSSAPSAITITYILFFSVSTILFFAIIYSELKLTRDFSSLLEIETIAISAFETAHPRLKITPLHRKKRMALCFALIQYFTFVYAVEERETQASDESASEKSNKF